MLYLLLIEVTLIGYLFGNIKLLKQYEIFILLVGLIVGLIDSESILFYFFDFVYFVYLIYLTIRIVKIKKEANSIKIFLFLIVALVFFNQIYYLYH